MMAANYRHIGGQENRLGRHYSRFLPFSPAVPHARQSLAAQKFHRGGSNRRSQAKAVRCLSRSGAPPCAIGPFRQERSSALTPIGVRRPGYAIALAAPEASQIVAPDLDHIVFVNGWSRP